MRIPRHIGIIPDGNRRWAKDRGKRKQDGYEHGLAPGVEVVRQAQKYGVEEITFYGFTMDNCKRPQVQVVAFKEACVEAARLISQEKVSLLVVGNSESKCFPEELKQYLTRIDCNGGGIKVNLLINYGWEWDLSEIRRENGEKVKEMLHSADISRIDLIIRWGNRRRLSGFLPVQSVYADFYVIEEMWPDYAPEQFDRAMEWYHVQDVTLGG